MSTVFFKDSKPSTQVLTLLSALVFFALLASLTGGALQLLGVDWSRPSAQRLFQMGAQGLMFLLPAVGVTWLFRGPVVDALGLRPSGWRTAAAAVALFLLALPLFDLLARLNDAWHWSLLPEVEAALRRQGAQSEALLRPLLEQPGWGAMAFNLVALAAVPALCEECFFRGALQPALARWTRRPHLAVMLTAALFSLAHAALFAFLPRFVMGVVLGYFYLSSRSIWPGVCAHFANNALVVVAHALYLRGRTAVDWSETMPVPLWVAVVCTLAATVLFALAFGRKMPKEGTQTDV